jgi:hypothetical protein
MALHTQLPIYKDAYKLFDVVTELPRNMPRDFKASFGGRLRDEAIDIMVLVFRANTARNKEQHLLDLTERVQVIDLMLRASKDKRLISTGQYAKAIELTTSIGKQATGWRRAATSPAS